MSDKCLKTPDMAQAVCPKCVRWRGFVRTLASVLEAT
jgi:hypothetical protein